MKLLQEEERRYHDQMKGVKTQKQGATGSLDMSSLKKKTSDKKSKLNESL
jgi:hypothetical protein